VDERDLLERTLAGDPAGTHALVRHLVPVVQARVARVLVRRRGTTGRDVRQEVEDLAQEVFVALFAGEARVLRAWDPSRGLSLASFCGLIAEREVASILRSGRRSPWKEEATELDELERSLEHVAPAEASIATRERLTLVVDRLRDALSPRGLELFQRLVVDEEDVASVCASTGMTPDAVYAWKSRIGKLLRKLAADLAASEPRTSAALATDSVSERRDTARKTQEETK
jgi:RNA polymerase sigma-70 factor (ECF subfamily)